MGMGEGGSERWGKGSVYAVLREKDKTGESGRRKETVWQETDFLRLTTSSRAGSNVRGQAVD